MSGTPIRVGLVGSGIQASLSPRLHMREADALGLRYRYRLIDLDELGLEVAVALPEILTAAERLGYAGLNVTFPCKQTVIAELDDLSPEARAIGAVNTVLFRDGRRVGHNTDGSGFAESFRRHLPDVARRRVVQFGAGGGGAAVAHALLTLGVGELLLVDTDRARARDLATSLCARFGAGRAGTADDLAAALSAADGLVNTTPVGMEKFPGMALPAQLLSPRLWVADIVYFPLQTELLRQARIAGCRTLSGGGMAVFQAVEAFRLFSGAKPDAERMLAHFAGLTGAA